MLHIMRILNALGLLVELPMILRVNNSGAVGTANNWSSSDRIMHIDRCKPLLPHIFKGGRSHQYCVDTWKEELK